MNENEARIISDKAIDLIKKEIDFMPMAKHLKFKFYEMHFSVDGFFILLSAHFKLGNCEHKSLIAVFENKEKEIKIGINENDQKEIDALIIIQALYFGLATKELEKKYYDKL